MMVLQDYLNVLSQISPLSQEDFELISKKSRIRSFHKQDILLKPGEVQQQCYLILDGILMSYFDGDTKIHVQAFAYAPGFAAIPQSFITQTPSTHFLQAMSDIEIAEIHYHDLQTAFDKSHALERAFRKMTEQLLIGVLNRNTEMHTLSMEQRFRTFMKRSPHLLKLIPHKYLASYLGIDPTNFSKLFNSIHI